MELADLGKNEPGEGEAEDQTHGSLSLLPKSHVFGNVGIPTIGALGWNCVWDAERVCLQAVPCDGWRVALKESTDHSVVAERELTSST